MASGKETSLVVSKAIGIASMSLEFQYEKGFHGFVVRKANLSVVSETGEAVVTVDDAKKLAFFNHFENQAEQFAEEQGMDYLSLLKEYGTQLRVFLSYTAVFDNKGKKSSLEKEKLHWSGSVVDLLVLPVSAKVVFTDKVLLSVRVVQVLVRETMGQALPKGCCLCWCPAEVEELEDK